MALYGAIASAMVLLVSLFSAWLIRLTTRLRERADGAPSLPLVRRSELSSTAIAVVALALAWLSGGRLLTLGHLWRHDLWSALLFGALAGSFLHLVGGGSPLPIASVGGLRSGRRRATTIAGLATVAVFVAGETGVVLIWMGAGLPALLHLLPRLFALPVIAAGYGLVRAAGGQDHPLLGAIDGLLLCLLYLLTGSIVAVVLAHFLADALAYVTAAGQAEESALALEAGEPAGAARG